MSDAPYFEDAAGLPGGVASWETTSDGVRIRLVRWPLEGAKGTIFIFPGRTEYAEKYGRIAALLRERGYASLAIDWRGQGLSDRLLDDASIGHIEQLSDFQIDLAAVIRAAQDMPKPWVLMGHSMGGAIGLEALMGDHPFKGGAFSGPMWGLQLPTLGRPVVTALAAVAHKLNFGHLPLPGQARESYIADESFDGNDLTTDRESWDWMRSHLENHPELRLGAPSLSWVHAALKGARELDQKPSPDVPALVWLGTDEPLVDPARVHSRVARWSNAELKIQPDQRHELLMETPDRRTARVDELVAFVERLT